MFGIWNVLLVIAFYVLVVLMSKGIGVQLSNYSGAFHRDKIDGPEVVRGSRGK